MLVACRHGVRQHPAVVSSSLGTLLHPLAGDVWYPAAPSGRRRLVPCCTLWQETLGTLLHPLAGDVWYPAAPSVRRRLVPLAPFDPSTARRQTDLITNFFRDFGLSLLGLTIGCKRAYFFTKHARHIGDPDVIQCAVQ